MSESHDDFERALQQQFQHQKKRVKAPDAIKRNLLAKARRNAGSRQPVFSLVNFQAVAVLASLFVFGWIFWWPGDAPSSQPDMAMLEYHILESEQATANAGALSYGSLSDLATQSSTLLADNRKHVRLAIQPDGAWQLRSCEHNDMLLSKELVAMLQEYKRVPLAVSPDKPFDVLLAADGKIMQLRESTEPLICD